jgi:nucleotide-binding universal stress UspA family protein
MYKNILIPVVLDNGADVQASYSVAQTLADDGAKFTVMHVLEQIQGFVAIDIPAEALAKADRAAETALAESAKALPDAATALLRGHPGTTIVNYASENGIDCIVIASHKPGIEDFFLGSTAARVVRHASCSVHVIR